MPLHARIVAWVFIVFGVVGLALAAGLFLLWAGLGTAALVEDGFIGGGAVGWSVGIAMGGVVAAISVPNIIAGYGLLRRRPWAKAFGIGLGVLNLIFAPIGTIFGIYAIIALLADDTKPSPAQRQLAERGEPSTRAERRDGAPRSLFDVALENAVEGFVNETFAAVVALHQARFATAPSVRVAMETIAREEVGHAELAWAIHRWAMGQLDGEEREAVERSMQEALERLVAGTEEAPAAARDELGLPDAARAAALARGLRDALPLSAAA